MTKGSIVIDMCVPSLAVSTPGTHILDTTALHSSVSDPVRKYEKKKNITNYNSNNCQFFKIRKRREKGDKKEREKKY